MLDLTACPAPGCSSTAQIYDRSTMESTDGPVEHVRVRCLNRHHFLMPAAMLTSPHLAGDAQAAASAPSGSP